MTWPTFQLVPSPREQHTWQTMISTTQLQASGESTYCSSSSGERSVSGVRWTVAQRKSSAEGASRMAAFTAAAFTDASYVRRILTRDSASMLELRYDIERYVLAPYAFAAGQYSNFLRSSRVPRQRLGVSRLIGYPALIRSYEHSVAQASTLAPSHHTSSWPIDTAAPKSSPAGSIQLEVSESCHCNLSMVLSSLSPTPSLPPSPPFSLLRPYGD